MACAKLLQPLFTAGVNYSSTSESTRLVPSKCLCCLFRRLDPHPRRRAYVDATYDKGQTALLGYLRHYKQRPACMVSSSLALSATVSLLAGVVGLIPIPHADGFDVVQQVMDLSLTNGHMSDCLLVLLRNAKDLNASEPRVEAAISSLGRPIVCDLLVVSLSTEVHVVTRYAASLSAGDLGAWQPWKLL